MNQDRLVIGANGGRSARCVDDFFFHGPKVSKVQARQFMVNGFLCLKICQ